MSSNRNNLALPPRDVKCRLQPGLCLRRFIANFNGAQEGDAGKAAKAKKNSAAATSALASSAFDEHSTGQEVGHVLVAAVAADDGPACLALGKAQEFLQRPTQAFEPTTPFK